MTYFNTQNYLKRLQLTSPPSIDEIGLKALQKAQQSCIPFENFDIPAGQGINLAAEHVFNKLVNQQRGGYCFELNALMLMALQQFGFQARALLARVHLGDRPSGRSHQLCLVELDGEQWIVDTGFGSQTPRAPLPLRLDEVLETDLQTFRFIADDRFGYLLQSHINGNWEDLYSFDMQHVCENDLEYGNHCTSTMPTSTFVTSWVGCLRTENGQKTLLNLTYKEVDGDQTVIKELTPGIEYLAVLEQQFGIKLDCAYESLMPFQELTN